MATVTIAVANPTDKTLKSIASQSMKVHVVGFHGPAAEFYNNTFLLQPRSDIYGFMTGNDVFKDNESLEKIVSTFDKDMALIGLVYSDRILNKNGNIIQQIYPPFEAEHGVIYNPTIFVNGHIDVKLFDTTLEHLLSYDVIRKIGTSAKVIHIPEFLIESEFVSYDITKELEDYVRKSS